MKDPTLKARLKRLNAELHHLTMGVYHDRQCPNVIHTAVKDCGFDSTTLNRQWTPEAEGWTSIDIGGVTLMMVWCKMPVTGRFEIAACAY